MNDMEVLGLVDIPFWLLTTFLVLAWSIWYNFPYYTHFQKYSIDGPTPLPFVGNLATALFRGLLKNEVAMYQKYKKKRCYGSFVIGTTPTLTITDVDLIKEVLVKQFNKFANRRLLAKCPPPINKLMFNLYDDHWKHIRNMTTPAFTSGRLKRMTELIKCAGTQLALNLKEKTETNEDIDIKHMCGCFAMDVTAGTLVGIQVDSLKDTNSEFVHHAKQLITSTSASIKVLIAVACPQLNVLLSKFGIKLFDTSSFDFFAKVGEQAVQQRKTSTDQYNDLVDMMIKNEVSEDQIDRKTSYPHGDKLAWSSKGILRDEIHGQSVSIILAGYDTMAGSLHYLIYHLALDQAIQEKVFKEISEEIGDSDITYEKVNKLEYLDMCIQETLRMYPPLLKLDRMAGEDVTIDGITIPKGTHINIPVYAIHYDPDVYSEPQIFDPLRFTNEAKQQRNQYTWMPFGLGPRNCIGMRLALLELKIAAATVLKICRFIRAANTPEPENLQFVPAATMRTKPTIMLKVALR